MRSAYLALLVAVLGATEARADDRTVVRARIIEAINKRDARAVESLVAFPLRAEKLRFASEPCRKFWGVSVLVRTSDLSAFVDCLASQTVTALASSADPKVNAIVGPGFPLAIAFNSDDKVIALTSSSEPGSKPLRIEPTTFASHVTGFTREIAPSKDTQQALDARHAKTVLAELSLCVDAAGATVPVATVAESDLKSYEQDVVRAAQGWKIEPFQFDGRSQLACASYMVGDPAPPLDQPLPSSAPRAPNVDPKRLETYRIRGAVMIVPDDATKKKIDETASKRVVGAFKLCIDPQGVPDGISVLKSTGYASYDQKIEREMATWAYRPILIDGRAVRVCTAVSFIYSTK